uniref:Uncharacterized protein n=1 Tax=Anopheles culicifacies TaxID=139723 RepID=A0A182LUQ6_9DIPT
MFIFLLFASDGCRNVCQIFSQRLVARIRKHRRKRDEGAASPNTESRWTACLRTWIKCICTGACSTGTPATTGGATGRVCIEDTRTAGWATLAKLLFQKLLHQA